MPSALLLQYAEQEIPHFRLGKKKDEDTHGEGDGSSGYEDVQRLTGEYTKAVTWQI